MNWLGYALTTVFFWGVYGVLLHLGRSYMPMTPSEVGNAGLKAFLFVCVAYAVIGVAAFFLLRNRGSDMSFGIGGISWSLIAGLAGAAGAFTLVLALGAAATPVKFGGGGYGAMAAVAVMPIVFGGAPIVNAIVTIMKSPPAGGVRDIDPVFYLGMIVAICGVVITVKTAPAPAAGHGPAPTGAVPAPAAAAHSAEAPAPAHPVDAPAAAHPAEAPAAAHPVEAPAVAHPVEAPAAAHPVEAPVAAHPVEAPAAVHPVDAPAPVHPVEAPAPVHPVDAPAPAHPADAPVVVPAPAPTPAPPADEAKE